MRYVEEFRDPVAAKGVLRAIADVVDQIGATRDNPVRDPASYARSSSRLL